MNNKKILTISVLPVMWLIYIIFELFTGRITDIRTIIFNITLILLFFLVGYITYNISLKYDKGFSYNTLITIFLVFFLIDQGLKIVIKFFYFNLHIMLIPDSLYFSPMINTDGSWLNARFGTSLSFPLLIIVNILALILFIEVYRYYRFKGNKDFWSDMCFVFVLCGGLCSLIDKIFYGGSLDFIGISNLFIADIKDIYINLGIFFFIIALFNNGYLFSDEETSLKDDINSIKKFLVFIKNDIINTFKS